MEQFVVTFTSFCYSLALVKGKNPPLGIMRSASIGPFEEKCDLDSFRAGMLIRAEIFCEKKSTNQSIT